MGFGWRISSVRVSWAPSGAVRCSHQPPTVSTKTIHTRDESAHQSSQDLFVENLGGWHIVSTQGIFQQCKKRGTTQSNHLCMQFLGKFSPPTGGPKPHDSSKTHLYDFDIFWWLTTASFARSCDVLRPRKYIRRASKALDYSENGDGHFLNLSSNDQDK
jgi:hypothetical protein